MESRIYKVVSQTQWEEAVEEGTFRGAPIDHQDGYIHFSTAAQVKETVALHFRGQTNLLLVELQTKDFAEELKWEPSRGGELFPHLYGTFRTSAASRVLPIAALEDGTHKLPEL